MWKEKKPNGKVKYYERYRDPLTDRTHIATITVDPVGRRTDDLAHEALNRKIRSILSACGKPEDITFSDLCRRRIKWAQDHLKPQTAESIRAHLATLTRLIGGDVRVSALNAPVVADRFHDDSPARYNERLKNFKAMMRWAYRNDLVDNISYLDKLQRAKDLPVREKDKEKYLEHGEMKVVLDAMTVEQWKLLTEFLILTGMRVGEAIALTAADVDVQRREISISKTYSLTIMAVSTTKTEASCRTIDMQDELMDCYHRIRKHELENQLQFGFRSNLVFSDVNTGSYIHYDAYRKYLRETTLKAIGRPLTPHALRHTHVAMLAEAGMPLETIMRRVGHANSQVTKDVYMHVTDRMRDRDRALLQAVTIL